MGGAVSGAPTITGATRAPPGANHNWNDQSDTMRGPLCLELVMDRLGIGIIDQTSPSNGRISRFTV
jgi:hypothetical protein